MNLEPDEAPQRSDETSSPLTEMFETIEHEVRETAQGAATALTAAEGALTATVQTVMEGVAETAKFGRQTVRDAVESVRNAFDLTRQVRRHPWVVLLGSVVAGYVLGRLILRRRA